MDEETERRRALDRQRKARQRQRQRASGRVEVLVTVPAGCEDAIRAAAAALCADHDRRAGVAG